MMHTDDIDEKGIIGNRLSFIFSIINSYLDSL